MRSFARALLLVAAGAAHRGVEVVLLDRVEQRRRLELVARGARARLLDDAALVDRLLDARDDEALAELGDAAVAELDHLGEVVAGVDVHDREREAAGPEGLLGEPQQHDRVLAAGEEQHRPLALGGDLAHDVDRLGLELVEMGEREGRDGDAHRSGPTSLATVSEAELARACAMHDGAADSLGRAAFGVEPELGARRLLVGIGDAGELGDLAGVRLRVEALRVAALALLERGRDVDLDERRVLLGQRARLLPRLLVRRDRGDDDDGAGAREPRGDPADPLDVRVAVLLREAEALGQVLAHDVAVEAVDEHAALLELGGDEAGDRRLAGGRQAREPDDEAAAHLVRTDVQAALGLRAAAQRPSRPAPGCVQCVQPIEA